MSCFRILVFDVCCWLLEFSCWVYLVVVWRFADGCLWVRLFVLFAGYWFGVFAHYWFLIYFCDSCAVCCLFEFISLLFILLFFGCCEWLDFCWFWVVYWILLCWFDCYGVVLFVGLRYVLLGDYVVGYLVIWFEWIAFENVCSILFDWLNT